MRLFDICTTKQLRVKKLGFKETKHQRNALHPLQVDSVQLLF